MSIESPCIKVCRMDEADELCVGCGRTLDEIARWDRMNQTERACVLAALRTRNKRHARCVAMERKP